MTHKISLMGCMLATIVPLLVLSPACSVDTPWGPFEINPKPPTEPVLLGCVEIDGEIYCLYDVNGDGKVDFVKRMRDGRWFEVIDPFDVDPTWVEPPRELNYPYPADPDDDGLQDSDAPIGWDDFVALLEELTGGEQSAPGISGSVNGRFGQLTTAEWIEYYGLDIEPGTTAVLQNLALNSFDTETWHTSVTLYWSTAFSLPAMASHDLAYEWYALEGDSVDDPWFLVIQFEGDVTDMIAALVEIGAEAFSFRPSFGQTWSVVANDETATLYLNGAEVTTVSLP